MNWETVLIAFGAFTLGHLLGWMSRAKLERERSEKGEHPEPAKESKS